ncbi:MAG: hypothetical protein AAF996_01095 [Pseudomonadota bacterium]
MFTSTHHAVSAKPAQFAFANMTPDRQPNAITVAPNAAHGTEANPRMPLFEARRRRQTRRANR